MLEVYTDVEIQKLKNSKDPIFDNLKTEQDLVGNAETDSDITFGNTNNEKYSDLIDTIDESNEENPYLKKDKTHSLIMEDGESVDVDDI